MKTVYSTKSQVAHAWATQSQPFGRSPTPSGGGFGWASGAGSATCPRVRFVGRIFYSYTTPVARLEPIHGREALVLLTVPNEWGPSTASHIGEASGAVSHLIGRHYETGAAGRSFEVPHIGGHSRGVDYWQENSGLHPNGEAPEPSAIDHGGNLLHLIQEYRDVADKFLRMRGDIWCGWIPGHKWEVGQPEGAGRYTPAETVETTLLNRWASAMDYAEYFAPLVVPADFPQTFDAVNVEAAGIMVEREARAARALAKLTPAVRERREKEKAARADKAARSKALQWATAEEKLAGWREGLKVQTYQLPRSPERAAYIRATGVKRNKAGEITGGTLETSQGARVPLRDAVRVYQFLVCIRERGEAWEPRGLRSIRVGQFMVNRVDASGDFVAGCHRFAWPEIHALAESLGVAALPCDTAAESA